MIELNTIAAKDLLKSRDALDKDRNRYQIKGCKISRRNPSRQLSATRGLPEGGFQYLAAVLFDPD